MDAPDTRYVTVGDAEVAYQIVGEGPLDLVYHHGLCHLDLQWTRPRRLHSTSASRRSAG